MQLVWIGLGGCCGAILRYLAVGWVQSTAGGGGFPWGTAVVNMTGCFLIGVLLHLAGSTALFPPGARAFFIIGLLGAFTTFSAYGNETLDLLINGRVTAALLNAGCQVVCGVGLVLAGRILAGMIWR
ncbi:MAG: fluoride efflux transporter CrcB [Desulfobacterales bacterium]|nr:MAG: fluoride efflux transporter CrcB [Desulfobacterales bacterium]